MQKTYFNAEEVSVLAKDFSGDVIALALSLLPQAANLAVVPVSHFQVGAIAIDDEGNFYLGANQEALHAPLAQSVHAEQSAVSHALARGAKRIAHIVVNHTPCGHCRQFLNELRGCEDLRIHLPHSRDNLLHSYLPDSFGPSDLDMEIRLLDRQDHQLTLANPAADDVVEAAFNAANASYAPYSGEFAGVALQCEDGEIFTGTYAENAAYNPSFPPLQSALNFLRLSGRKESEVQRGVLVCYENGGHEAHTRALWQACFKPALEIHFLKPAE